MHNRGPCGRHTRPQHGGGGLMYTTGARAGASEEMRGTRCMAVKFLGGLVRQRAFGNVRSWNQRFESELGGLALDVTNVRQQVCARPRPGALCRAGVHSRRAGMQRGREAERCNDSWEVGNGQQHRLGSADSGALMHNWGQARGPSQKGGKRGALLMHDAAGNGATTVAA